VSNGLNRAIVKAMVQDAHWLRKKIVTGIRKQAPAGKAFKPLAPTTIAVRRFRGRNRTKALIDRGDLRNSIQVKKFRGGAFVGALRAKRSSSGKSLADIAAVHEFGSKPIVIRMTDKMRRFLMAAFRQRKSTRGIGVGEGSPSSIVLRVPPRPFLRPVFDKYAKRRVLVPRLLDRVVVNMKGALGKPTRTPPK
jgi:hypothetical protein